MAKMDLPELCKSGTLMVNKVCDFSKCSPLSSSLQELKNYNKNNYNYGGYVGPLGYENIYTQVFDLPLSFDLPLKVRRKTKSKYNLSIAFLSISNFKDVNGYLVMPLRGTK